VTDSPVIDHSPGVELIARADATSLRAGAHDRAIPSFDAVYEDGFELVWRILRRMGVATAQLEDASQDVFLVVHRRLAGFEGRSKLKTWVAGIAIRVASDYRKRSRRDESRYELGLDRELADPNGGPAEEVERREALALVHALLLELEPKQREVFVLVELEQMSAPEVAEALSANLNTVYSRLRLARKAFNASLERRQREGVR
jgi:RNA polymerase sigma-70 factor (ECF subfamily)